MGARRSKLASTMREQGLKKKAGELATLCGVDVCLLGRRPDGELFFWPDEVQEVRRIAERYLAAVEGGKGQAPVAKRKRVAAEAMGSPSSGASARPKKQKRGSDAEKAAESNSQPPLMHDPGEGTAEAVGPPSPRAEAGKAAESNSQPTSDAAAPDPSIKGVGRRFLGGLVPDVLAVATPSTFVGYWYVAAGFSFR